MATIYSQLMKADYLIMNSAIFPNLVRAACAYHGVPYTQDALEYAGSRPEIINALPVEGDSVLDDVLYDFATGRESADAMDKLILSVVQVYKDERVTNGNN